MNFTNSGTTYIVNAGNPGAAFIGGQAPSQQQQQHRLITMPLQQQQGQQPPQILLQQQPPQQAQQQQHIMLQQHHHHQQQQHAQQQQQQQQPVVECRLVEPPSQQASSSNEKPLVRGKTSPYGFFVKMCYEEHKKKYPTEFVQVTEISKKCSQKWKTMSEDEKKRFYELAQKDAERYQAEVAAYGGDDVMRKRKRAKKDPNAPKRALSAFFFFSNEKRPEVQQNHPEWKVGQVAQELGRCWKSTREEDRQIYEKRAINDKERYAEEMRIYRLANGKMPMPKLESKHEPDEDVGGDEPHLNQQQTPISQLPMQLLEEQINV